MYFIPAFLGSEVWLVGSWASYSVSPHIKQKGSWKSIQSSFTSCFEWQCFKVNVTFMATTDRSILQHWPLLTHVVFWSSHNNIMIFWAGVLGKPSPKLKSFLNGDGGDRFSKRTRLNPRLWNQPKISTKKIIHGRLQQSSWVQRQVKCSLIYTVKT